MRKEKEIRSRVAYFTNTYPRATDTFIQREVFGLRNRGIDVITFAVRKADESHSIGPEIIEEKSRTTYILPVNPLSLLVLNFKSLIKNPRRYLGAISLALKTSQPGISGGLRQIFYFQEAVVLAHELETAEIDHLHNHLGDASGNVTLIASKLSDISYSITFHGPHIFFEPIRWALREKIKFSRFIVCISNYCKSQLMLHSDAADWEKLQIVHCGVDVEHYSLEDLVDSRNRMIYTGRLAREKGLPVLFDALKMLKDEDYDFSLTLIGDGPDRSALEQHARELEIADRVVFEGYKNQDEVRDYVGKSDIFVLPSFAEGVPVSLMEAMASGVPVISTYVGGIAELIDNDRTGLLVPPADMFALRDAIKRYFDDPKLREEVSCKARETILSHFNLDIELDKLANSFLESTPNA